jgi:death on curing protein
VTGTEQPDHVAYLDLDDAVESARALFGDPPPTRDIGLLGSAVARPQTTLLGEDAYPDMWSKAAALLQSIVSNHALIDGNKRLGWVATAAFLEINGIAIDNAANDDVYDLVIEVATTHQDVEYLAGRLRTVVGGDT